MQKSRNYWQLSVPYLLALEGQGPPPPRTFPFPGPFEMDILLVNRFFGVPQNGLVLWQLFWELTFFVNRSGLSLKDQRPAVTPIWHVLATFFKIFVFSANDS